MPCLKGSQPFSSTLSSKETTASSSMHPSTTSIREPECPQCATLWARRNVANKTEPLPSVCLGVRKDRQESQQSQTIDKWQKWVNPGAPGSVGVRDLLCLYNYKMDSETTGIVFCLFLWTYIHTGSMTTQASLEPGSVSSSLPKLVGPFPRSFCPPGMAEKLTL